MTDSNCPPRSPINSVVTRVISDNLTLVTTRLWLQSLYSAKSALAVDNQSCKCGVHPFNDVDDPCPICTIDIDIAYCKSLMQGLEKRYIGQLPPGLRQLFLENAPSSLAVIINATEDDPNQETDDEK